MVEGRTVLEYDLFKVALHFLDPLSNHIIIVFKRDSLGMFMHSIWPLVAFVWGHMLQHDVC
jgi:signal-transduction protein with cAMP-binding, CBS, and nucleotidyltransferase domain